MSVPGELRRGLPRVAGGEPWPPAAVVSITPAAVPEPVASAPVGPPTTVPPDTLAPPGLRRGLPRQSGGEPWPPAGRARTAAPVPTTGTPAPVAQAASISTTDAGAPHGPSKAPATVSVPATDVAATGLGRAPATEPEPTTNAAPSDGSANGLAADSVPTTDAPATASPAKPPVAARSTTPEPARAPGARLGRFTRRQVLGAAALGSGWVVVLAAGAVLMARALLDQPFMQDFLAAYPGDYALPPGSPLGVPGWLAWQHFLNAFLMVFIVKTGLQVRREQRPPAYWAPRRNPGAKVSLTVWFHQAMDILWLANGVAFLVLIFVTGQWVRIVPTSWEVLPNALSAGLQYISLDWPTENGWVHYNALQQLAYFSVTFIAAPLSVLSGWRMSGLWPRRNPTLSRVVPLEWARRLHFPLMLYFVCFIAVHVFLVLATGALRNLNHMYAAQGSVDPTAFATNWTGFFWFVASVLVTAGAVVAVRPMLIAPLARLFGTVSGR